jgi:hypothetical protein
LPLPVVRRMPVKIARRKKYVKSRETGGTTYLGETPTPLEMQETLVRAAGQGKHEPLPRRFCV